MKLWKLEPRDIYLRDEPNPDNPWRPWYDKMFKVIVRAEDEESARRWANHVGGEETIDHQPWLDAKYSTCEELLPDGEEGLIIRNVRYA